MLTTALSAACSDDPARPAPGSAEPGVRIVNAYAGPVDVSIDGQVVLQGLAPGAIDTAAASPGAHTVTMRSMVSSSSIPAVQSVTTASGSLVTLAAVRAAGGAFAVAALDDTNSVVPSGATKVRVLHLAPNAGTLQVFRTQPDFQQPVSWQFPFEYQPTPTALSAPFYQSTPGTWEVRVWQTPADASGWSNAPVRVSIPLASGEKRTVLILDKPGGGVRVELL